MICLRALLKSFVRYLAHQAMPITLLSPLDCKQQIKHFLPNQATSLTFTLFALYPFRYSLRNQVDAANNDRLQHLKGPIHRYTASDWGDASKLNGCMAPTELELKLDAQVMLIKNLTPNLVNGSTGIVVGFTNEGKFMNESMINDRLLEKERPNGTSRLDTLPQILPTDVYPIVRFVNGQEIVISPEKWEVEQPG